MASNNRIRFAFASVLALLFVFPFLWMFASSFMNESEILSYPPKLLPRAVRLDNYMELFVRLPFATYLRNTVTIAVSATLGVVISCSLTGFVLARLRFRGRGLLFALFLATMLIPGEVTLIPVFSVMRALGWVNTRLPLIVPSYFATSIYSVFLFRQYFIGFPQELDDAAAIDGASSLQLFLFVMLPLAIPALLTVAVLNFMWNWSDLLEPVIYLSDRRLMTLSVGLASLYRTGGDDTGAMMRYDLLMAGSIVSIVPTALLFVLTQRSVIAGISLGDIQK